MRRLPRVLALGGAALALAGSAYAADQIAGRERAPASATVTLASTAPLFQETGLTTGQTLERCTELTNEGPQPADVTLFGTAARADLSPWLDLELVRGTLPDGTAPGDCTGFTADAADYGAGTDGVVFRGTLASLPDADAGIADPTRWAAGETHAYLLRVHYTGTNPQQGLSTEQTFAWGVTPYDDRPPDPFVDPGQTPAGAGGANQHTGGAPGKFDVGRACTIVKFPSRSFVGARAVTRPKKLKKAQRAALGSSASGVVSSGEDPSALSPAELEHRSKLLAMTRATAARRMPVLVVRLSPKDSTHLGLQVALRKNTKVSAPKRWQWVRYRLNGSATKSTLKWPFSATAQMSQLKLGYNQLDLTLNRGNRSQRLHGLSKLLRRSFAFVVSEPTTTVAGGVDCTLG